MSKTPHKAERIGNESDRGFTVRTVSYLGIRRCGLDRGQKGYEGNSVGSRNRQVGFIDGSNSLKCNVEYVGR